MQVKKIIMLTLLFSTALHAVDYNILMEERVDSRKSSQTVLKFQAGNAITENLYFFSGFWLRDKLPIIYEDNHLGNPVAGDSEYINFMDLYGGLSYSFVSWFQLYGFYEVYYDRTGHSFGTFIAFGFSGTILDMGNHNIGYFSELYLAKDSDKTADGYGIFGSESAIKYKYGIYDKNAALYIQAVWNTDAQYTQQYRLQDGYYSTRFGVQLNF